MEFLGLVLVGIVMMFSEFIRRIISTVVDYLENRFTTRFTVTSKEESYRWITKWISDQFGKQQITNINVSSYIDFKNVDRYNRELSKTSKQLLFTPGVGTHWIYHKKSVLMVNFQRETKLTEDPLEIITIRAFRSDSKFLLSIIDEARQHYFSEINNQVAISMAEIHGGAGWKPCFYRQPRSMDTIFLAENVTDMIIDDAKLFLSSKEWYKSNGIPHRRGYLFYGPPGTGKTSFILAFAALLKRVVCIASLTEEYFSDRKLMDQVISAPDNAIILFEDVDALFKKRTTTNNSVSFSGLINCIDGLATKEGLIMIFTSNHPENLDEALIRPGRVDLKILFDKANEYQIRQMLRNFFPNTSPSEEKEFCKIVKPMSYSSAELQGLFLKYRDDLDELLRNTESYLSEVAQKRNFTVNKTDTAQV